MHTFVLRIYDFNVPNWTCNKIGSISNAHVPGAVDQASVAKQQLRATLLPLRSDDL